MKRKSRLPRKGKIVKGYFMIPKTSGFPSRGILSRLELKPLDYRKYKRKKNGKTKTSR